MLQLPWINTDSRRSESEFQTINYYIKFLLLQPVPCFLIICGKTLNKNGSRTLPNFNINLISDFKIFFSKFLFYIFF